MNDHTFATREDDLEDTMSGGQGLGFHASQSLMILEGIRPAGADSGSFNVSGAVDIFVSLINVLVGLVDLHRGGINVDILGGCHLA